MPLKLTKEIKDWGYLNRFPDYFFDGHVYLTVGSNGRADHWPTHFSEARLLFNRIVVSHQDTSKAGWTITDFLTGYAVGAAPTWTLAGKQLEDALDMVFADQIPINTQPFRSAFDRFLNEVFRAGSKSELKGYMSAAYAIIDQITDVDEQQLPMLPA